MGEVARARRARGSVFIRIRQTSILERLRSWLSDFAQDFKQDRGYPLISPDSAMKKEPGLAGNFTDTQGVYC